MIPTITMALTGNFIFDIINWVVKAIIGLVISAFSGIAYLFLTFDEKLATFDFTQLNNNFKILKDAESIFTGAGIGICVFIFAISLIKLMFGPIGSTKDSHLALFGRLLIAVLLIVCFKYAIYNYLLPGCNSILDKITNISQGALSDAWKNLTYTDSGQFDPVEGDSSGALPGALTVITTAVTAGLGVSQIAAVIAGLVILILFAAFVIALVQFSLFCGETYLVFGIALYASPIACATYVSKDTEGIFKSYFRFLISKIVLIIFNLFSIKMIYSGIVGLSNSVTAAGGSDDGSDSYLTNFVISFILVISIVKLSRKFGSYIANMLGSAGGGDAAQANLGVLATNFTSGMRVRDSFHRLGGFGSYKGKDVGALGHINKMKNGRQPSRSSDIGNFDNSQTGNNSKAFKLPLLNNDENGKKPQGTHVSPEMMKNIKNGVKNKNNEAFRKFANGEKAFKGIKSEELAAGKEFKTPDGKEGLLAFEGKGEDPVGAFVTDNGSTTYYSANQFKENGLSSLNKEISNSNNSTSKPKNEEIDAKAAALKK